MAVKTREEAMRDCLASGMLADDCTEAIDAHVVDGAYCDGTIVITASGKRCVTDDLAARVAAARKASPLPAPVAPPSSTLGPVTSQEKGPSGAVLLAGAIGVAALLWWGVFGSKACGRGAGVSCAERGRRIRSQG